MDKQPKIGILEGMRSLLIFGFVLITLMVQQACKPEDDPQVPNACDALLEDYDPTFGVDYEDYVLYTNPGEQSNLDSAYAAQLKLKIGQVANTPSGVAYVARWVNRHFQFVNQGGANIGRVTADDLYERKEVYGCHSQALIISSILRCYGFPCVLVEAASVKWAYDYRENPNIGYIGHVMTEVYVDGSWILLDNNGAYVKDYAIDRPFISTEGSVHIDPAPQGYFVIAKGIDTWDYGVKSPDDTGDLMRAFANHLPCYTKYFDTTNYVWN